MLFRNKRGQPQIQCEASSLWRETPIRQEKTLVTEGSFAGHLGTACCCIENSRQGRPAHCERAGCLVKVGDLVGSNERGFESDSAKAGRELLAKRLFHDAAKEDEAGRGCDCGR